MLGETILALLLENISNRRFTQIRSVPLKQCFKTNNFIDYFQAGKSASVWLLVDGRKKWCDLCAVIKKRNGAWYWKPLLWCHHSYQPPSFSPFHTNATLQYQPPFSPFSTTIPPPCFQFITRRRIKPNFIWHIPWSCAAQSRGQNFGTKVENLCLCLITFLGPCHVISRYWQRISCHWLYGRLGQRLNISKTCFVGSFNTSNWQRKLPKQLHRWLGQRWEIFGQGRESSSPNLLPLASEKKSWWNMSKFASQKCELNLINFQGKIFSCLLSALVS